MKSIDPAHLVMVSSWGYFGRSTPELQPQNPFDLTWRGIGNNAGVRKADSFGCVWHVLPCILSEVHIQLKWWQGLAPGCHQLLSGRIGGRLYHLGGPTRRIIYIFSSQVRADQMPGPGPGPPREGQLMCTLFLSMRQ